MARIRFEQKTLSQRRFHIITSPDVTGRHVSADSRVDAEREVITARSMFLRKQSGDPGVGREVAILAVVRRITSDVVI